VSEDALPASEEAFTLLPEQSSISVGGQTVTVTSTQFRLIAVLVPMSLTERRNVINGACTGLVVTSLRREICAGFVPEVNARLQIPRKNRGSYRRRSFFSVFFPPFQSPQASFGSNPLPPDELRLVWSSFC
jgi:hypothetical protein